MNVDRVLIGKDIETNTWKVGKNGLQWILGKRAGFLPNSY